MTKKSVLLWFWFFLPVLLFGRTLLDYHGTESASKDTSYYIFEFTLSGEESQMIMNFNGALESGEISVWLGGGGYEVIGNYTDQDTFVYRNVSFGPLNNTEPITVKVFTTKAVGAWSIQLIEPSSTGILLSFLASGLIITAICLVLLIRWKIKSSESFIYPLIGAAGWFISIILKFLFAYWLNDPILKFIKSLLGQTGYLSVGSIYIGALTGFFEIGIALIFIICIKKLYENAQRGIGFGLGAGAIEALLIGFSQIGAFIMVISESPGTSNIMTEYSKIASTTPIIFLVAPVERMIAILCHVSSRALVVFAVARKKQIYFWMGFLLMTGLDAIAGYAHLSGYINTISTWWIELALLPFALLSILIIKWYYDNWKRTIPGIQSDKTVSTD